MPIQDLARSDVVTASPDTPVTDLARRMKDESVGSIVITEDNKPVGIITDRDLTVRVLGNDGDPSTTLAEDVMSADLYTVSPDDGFYEATQLMQEHGIRRLPVSEGDSLEGIITADDLTELMADEEQQLAEVLRAQRPEY